MNGVEFALVKKFFHADEDLLAILVTIGLKVGPFVEVVTNVFEIFGPCRANMLDGFIGPIPCAEDKFAGFVIFGENVFSLHGFRNGDSSESQGTCSDINMLDQIIPNFVGSNLGPVNH